MTLRFSFWTKQIGSGDIFDAHFNSLLDMGFKDEVEHIVNLCPLQRQTILFSATMTEDVSQLAKLSLKNPVRVSVDRLYDVAGTF